jgi:hypothetical protein
MNDRDELRASLGGPLHGQQDTSISKFKTSFENYFESLSIDPIWRLAIIGLIWPVSVFYLSSTLFGAIVFEILFWAIVFTSGWEVYFFIAILCFGVTVVHKYFSELSRWYRAGIWSVLAIGLAYIVFPVDLRSHESDIRETSSYISSVAFPRYGDDLEAPTIYVDKSFTPTLDSLLDNFNKQIEFRREFKQACITGLAAAKDGGGFLIWKETFDEVIFAFADNRELPFTNCDKFTEPVKAELIAEVEPTWSTPNSVDIYGRIEFAPAEFHGAVVPANTIVEILFSNSLKDQNFQVVDQFALNGDFWWGETTLKIAKPVLGQLRFPAQNGLPEYMSPIFEVRPNS